MRQRAQIAMALACEPELLIADEPTSALDVTVQAQLLDLLARLREELAMSTVVVSHDLGVVTRLADSVAVVYSGRIVETGPLAAVLTRPDHPYTRGLLDAVPRPGTAPGTRFRTMPGQGGAGGRHHRLRVRPPLPPCRDLLRGRGTSSGSTRRSGRTPVGLPSAPR